MGERASTELLSGTQGAKWGGARSWRRLRKIGRDPLGIAGSCILLSMVLLGLLAPVLGLPDPLRQDMLQGLKPPDTPGHPLGTDQFGRDLLSRLVWGGRISVAVGVAASLISLGIGIPLGMLSGYLGGWPDSIIMRTTDMMLAFPYILLALVIVAARGPGLTNALLAVAVTNIPFFIRITRGIVVTVTHQLFVEAAVAIGGTTWHILRRTILPALIPYITVSFSINIGWLILESSALSFLGLGVQPPLPEWGTMLAEGRTYVVIAPHLVLIPGLAIFLLVFNLNLAGDALRDVLDVTLE